MTTPSAYTLL